MVDITPATAQGRIMITSYGPNRYQLSDSKGEQLNHQGFLIIINDEIIQLSPQDEASLSPFSLDENLLKVLALGYHFEAGEILIIGTGEKLIFPTQAFRQLVRQLGPAGLTAAEAQSAGKHSLTLGLEVLTTAAACRTYNILVSEGRKVHLCLAPLPAE